jgi:hypothetical protein
MNPRCVTGTILGPLMKEFDELTRFVVQLGEDGLRCASY